jgi:hypothetical protein
MVDRNRPDMDNLTAFPKSIVKLTKMDRTRVTKLNIHVVFAHQQLVQPRRPAHRPTSKRGRKSSPSLRKRRAAEASRGC